MGKILRHTQKVTKFVNKSAKKGAKMAKKNGLKGRGRSESVNDFQKSKISQEFFLGVHKIEVGSKQIDVDFWQFPS